MGDIRCCKTPLLELLRSVPRDGRATHETREGVNLTYHMIPYGHHCHEAADEIERLRTALREIQDMSGITGYYAVDIARRALEGGDEDE